MTVVDLRRRQAARVLTEAGAPVVVLVAMPIVISIHAAGTVLAGVGWGLLAALFFGVIPFAYVLRGVRLGLWTDHHVSDRGRRKPVFFFSLASMLAGLLVLAASGAPRALLAFLTTLLVEAVLALGVTLAWKVSLHAWVSTIAGTALIVVYGPAAVLVWPLLAAVGWSRVELRDHTAAQVAIGALLGVVTTAVILPVLR